MSWLKNIIYVAITNNSLTLLIDTVITIKRIYDSTVVYIAKPCTLKMKLTVKCKHMRRDTANYFPISHIIEYYLPQRPLGLYCCNVVYANLP